MTARIPINHFSNFRNTVPEAAVVPLPCSLRDLLDLRGREHGADIFMIAPESGTTLTFGAFRGKVFALAVVLGQKGLRPGGRVAVILANGLNSAVALLAVMVAGGVAVPINPRLTEREIDGLLSQSGAELALSDQDLSGSFKSSGGSTDCSTLSSPETDNPYRLFVLGGCTTADSTPANEPLLSWDDQALILYTSGTTGQPKGVVLTHGNLLSNARYVVGAHSLTSSDRAICLLPLFHINGFVVTLLSPLLSAGSVIMPLRFSAERLWYWVQGYQATWFSAVPTIFSILLSQEDPPRNSTASLRFARSASAPLPVAVLEEFEQRFRVPVIETYGISEAACQVTANPLPPLPHKPGSAGIPHGNELKVVDEQGMPLQPGEVGEVVIRGDNVFKGYLNNPAADREVIRDNWFHTGDLGFLDQDGYLFLTGRKKELINRSGEKISPREVEEIIHRLPEVEAVGVVGVPHQLYGEEVAAFISVRPGRILAPEKVREFCREFLADFKIPRSVFFVDELPKGPSGKIQRRHLVDVYNQFTSLREKEKQT